MKTLKTIIEEKGISQRKLAELVGVTEVSMSRYVNGDRVPKAPIAIKIADVLGIDVTALYRDYEISLTIEEALKELASLTVDYGKRSEYEIARLDKALDMAIEALEDKQNPYLGVNNG